MAEKDNANPIILSDSELPTRRNRKRARDALTKPGGIRALLMEKPDYVMDPFYMSDVSSSDADSDDSTMEPIDEQEIYGAFTSHSMPFWWFCPPSSVFGHLE